MSATPRMTTEVMSITPELAGEMFVQNKSNRRMDRARVEEFVRIIRAGYWKLTHQGIAFNADGELVDGQHRLAAIIITGITCHMNVSYYEEDIGSWREFPIDAQRRRNSAQRLNIWDDGACEPFSGGRSWLLAPVTLLADVALGGMGTRKVLPHEMVSFWSVFGPASSRLARNKKRRGVCRAGVRAAFILFNKDMPDALVDTYEALSLQHHERLSLSLSRLGTFLLARSGNRRFVEGRNSARDVFVRTLSALRQPEIGRIQVKDLGKQIARERKVICDMMERCGHPLDLRSPLPRGTKLGPELLDAPAVDGNEQHGVA